MVTDQLDEANGSVIFSAITSHAINADAFEHLDEAQTIISSETDFDVQNQKLAGSGICTEEDNREMNLDNDMNNALRKTDISDPVSGGPSSLSTSDHQNLILESDICETSTLQNSCRILNLCVDNPGSLAAGFMDVESSDIEQCPTDVSDYSLQTSAEKLVRCCFVANLLVFCIYEYIMVAIFLIFKNLQIAYDCQSDDHPPRLLSPAFFFL